MRELSLLSIAVLAMLSIASPSVAGEYRESTSTEASMPAVAKTLTGKVVSVNQDAKTLTVKKTGWLRAEEVMFSVDDAAANHLADLKQDDWVDVTYAEADGKLIAKAIVKRIPPSDS